MFLGFGFEDPQISDVEIEDIVQSRLEHIKAKNWAEADRIRDELLEKGIQLKDGKDPATGERITTWEVKREGGGTLPLLPLGRRWPEGSDEGFP